MSTTIKTNHVPREVVYGYDLTEAERKEFDYYSSDELDMVSFVRYKGCTYDLDEFTSLPQTCHEMQGWHGARADSYFSGVVIRWCQEYEAVILGTYFS